ncbi:hypothetical protein Tco_1345441 [Tanacetum coccineum]
MVVRTWEGACENVVSELHPDNVWGKTVGFQDDWFVSSGSCILRVLVHGPGFWRMGRLCNVCWTSSIHIRATLLKTLLRHSTTKWFSVHHGYLPKKESGFTIANGYDEKMGVQGDCLLLLSSSIFADSFVSAATQSSCFEKIYLDRNMGIIGSISSVSIQFRGGGFVGNY